MPKKLPGPSMREGGMSAYDKGEKSHYKSRSKVQNMNMHKEPVISGERGQRKLMTGGGKG